MQEIISLGVYRYKNYTAAVNSSTEEALLMDFANILKAGGSTTVVVPEIQRIKFFKNFWNLTFATVATLTQHPLTAIFRLPTSSPETVELPSVKYASRIIENTIPTLHAIMNEIHTIGDALGFPRDPTGIDPSKVEELFNNTMRLHSMPDSKHRPSMLVDLEKGRPMEVEVIVGEVVRVARECGVHIPVSWCASCPEINI